MIGTFWNLCSACPSMPVDKLHSEYRSTYRWHEYTGPRQEVIRRPPQPVPDSGSAPSGGQNLPSPTVEEQKEVQDPSTTISGIEPAFPRRKKNPALAHRTHEFLAMSDGCTSDDSADSVAVERARSEERVVGRGRDLLRRSKSEGPPAANCRSGGLERFDNRSRTGLAGRKPAGRNPRVSRSDSDPCQFDQDLGMIAYLPSDENEPQPMSNATPAAAGVFKSAVSKISTEYRLQFAWPRGGGGANAAAAGRVAFAADETQAEGSGPPRKSLSMGAIKPPANQPPVPTHKKRIFGDNRCAGGAELEPLVSTKPEVIEFEDGEEKIQEESLSKEEKPLFRNEFNTEYKKKFRPFSQYNYVEGRFKPKKEPEQLLTELRPEDSWYQEVLELRRKAGEYKHRGWGTELVPQHIAELYNKQITLWEQVSRRSSLSALSLASTTPKLISKEEKDKENNKKSSPTKISLVRQSPIKPFSIYERGSVAYKKADRYDDNKKEKRSRKEATRRHNLDRSGCSTGRSQSVGPTATFTESTSTSPKRTKHTTPASSNKVQLQNGPTTSERRPRPTTLTTAAPSRNKSNRWSGSGTVKLGEAKSKATSAGQNFKLARNKSAEKKEHKEREAGNQFDKPALTSNQVEPEKERVVKSPPEPTRVKSPEQILMRSPEPVNWTVPLDTGKTFTVTQNVHEGDLVARPHSEVKSWTPATAPPPAPQSAPPQLDEYRPISGWKSPESDSSNVSPSGKVGKVETSGGAGSHSEESSKTKGTTLKCMEDPSFTFDTGKEESESRPVETSKNSTAIVTTITPATAAAATTESLKGSDETTGTNATTATTYTAAACSTTDSTPVGVSTRITNNAPITCSSTTPDVTADPTPITSTFAVRASEGDGGTHNVLVNPESPSTNPVLPNQSTGKSLATDVFEKARSRFDNFWGKSKDEPVEKEGKV